jgi:xylosylprotein 4-beta-galactosyltransferase
VKQLCDRLTRHLGRHGTEHQIFVVNQADRRPFNRGALANAAVAMLSRQGTIAAAVGTDAQRRIERRFDYISVHDVDRFPVEANASGCAHATANYYAFPSVSPRVLHPTSFAGGVLVLSTALYLAVNGFSNSYWGWGEEDNDLFLRLRWCGRPPMHGERLEDCMEHLDCTACKQQKRELDERVLHIHEQRLHHRLSKPRPHMMRDGLASLNFTLGRRPHRISCGQSGAGKLTVLDINLTNHLEESESGYSSTRTVPNDRHQWRPNL